MRAAKYRMCVFLLGPINTMASLLCARLWESRLVLALALPLNSTKQVIAHREHINRVLGT